MNIKNIYSIIVFFLIFTVANGQTQNKNEGLNARYSIFASYNYNQYDAFFPNLPEVPSCCPFYENGKGYGERIGIGFDLEMPYSLMIGLRGSYGNLSGNFETLESTTIRIDDEAQLVFFEHVIKAQLHEIAFEPVLTYKPIDYIEFHAGAHIGYMFSRNYIHYEKIVLPKDRGVFEDTKSRTRNYSEGEIPQVNPVYGAFILGISYLLPMNEEKTLFLAPEFFYTAGITDVVKGINWKINTYSIGLGIKYFPKDVIPEPIRIEPPREEFRQQLVLDTLIIESENVVKTKLIKGIPIINRKEQFVDNTKIIIEITKRVDTLYKRPKPNVEMTFSTPVINIETQYVTEAFPILPVVFFKDNSSEFIDFHNQLESGSNFSTSKLQTNPVLFNKEILNIIGERLVEHKKALITINGFADSVTENGNCELALNRAKRIQDYLNKVWKIEEERIKIGAKKNNCTPFQPTFSDNDSGYAENRRAVITSETQEILAPIFRERFSEVVNVEPKEIELDPSGTTEVGIKEWEIIGIQDGKEIFRKKGTGKPKLVTEEITLYKADALMNGKQLDIIFNVTDVEGNKGSEKKSIKIIKDISDLEVKRLSLILFDVSSDRIPKHAVHGVSELLKSLDDSTKVQIVGYSDVLGPFDFNKELSESRAQNTLNLIKRLAPDAQIIEMKGVGSLQYPPGIHSYSSPMERFLSRTVQINLIKKVSHKDIIKGR